jgi:internalin A
LTALTDLLLGDNDVSDLSPLSGLTELNWLYLDRNQISDILPLVNNPGMDNGDQLYLRSNPLGETSIDIHIPALQARGVTVYY